MGRIFLLLRLLRNRPARPLAKLFRSTNIARSFILARQFRFRNKIPSVGVPRRVPVITTFGHNISQRVRESMRENSGFQKAKSLVDATRTCKGSSFEYYGIR